MRNLLKLDILGHDDPTMIRMLEDLTGILMLREFRWMIREVMSLFQVRRHWESHRMILAAVQLGCLGIPEFGTDFVMQMLLDTKPKYFSDLVRICRTVPWYGCVAG